MIAENTATPTSTKGLILEYIRFIGKRLTFTEFPVTLHENARHPENCSQPFISKAAGMVHHIGSTVKQYQVVHHMQRGKVKLDETFKEKLHEAEMVLSSRLKHLEALALAWPTVVKHPENGPARGYSLITPEQLVEIDRQLKAGH